MLHAQISNQAFILWLIRRAGTVKWTALCKTLNVNPYRGDTASHMLASALRRLITAGLVLSSSPLDDLDFRSKVDVDSVTFSVTPLVAQIQDALQLSLRR